MTKSPSIDCIPNCEFEIKNNKPNIKCRIYYKSPKDDFNFLRDEFFILDTFYDKELLNPSYKFVSEVISDKFETRRHFTLPTNHNQEVTLDDFYFSLFNDNGNIKRNIKIDPKNYFERNPTNIMGLGALKSILDKKLEICLLPNQNRGFMCKGITHLKCIQNSNLRGVPENNIKK